MKYIYIFLTNYWKLKTTMSNTNNIQVYLNKRRKKNCHNACTLHTMVKIYTKRINISIKCSMYRKHALFFTNSFSPRFGNTPFLESNTIEINQKHITKFKNAILENSIILNLGSYKIIIPKTTIIYRIEKN